MTSPSPAADYARVEALRASIEPGCLAWVLIDPMLGEPLPGIAYERDGDPEAARAARAQAWQREIASVPLHPKVPLLPAQYPYLVGLLGAHDEWIEHTLQLAQAERAQSQEDGLLGEGGAAHRIGGWLVGSLDGEATAQALGTLMRLDTDVHTDARYLRLADRRVLDWARRVLGEDRLAGVLGSIQRWHYVDATGRLCTLSSASEQPQALRFSTPEWQLMERGEALHRIVAMALGEAAVATLSQEGLYDHALSALKAAEQARQRWPQRFTHPRDMQVWAALHLLCGDSAGRDDARRLMDAAPPTDEPPEPVRDLAQALAETLGLRPADATAA